jgi:ribosomal protein S18 acetylase RimI-like enzyme
VIRPGTAGDARRAAELHASGITEGFLSRLGPRFLERLYRCVVRDDGSFLFVSEEGGTVNGMIAGSESVPALYKRFLRREGLVAALVAAPRVVRNAGSVLETLRYGGANDGGLPSAELLSVAVDATARGQGLGRRLVEALQEEFARRGTATSKVVVGADNAPALNLYRECGYRDAATVQVHRDVDSQVLVWSSPAR